jgi:aminoglycoside phosphotransferase
MTLDFARGLPVAPGSNVRGDQADTTWLFLLPSLELGETLVVGSAPAGTLKALEPLSTELTSGAGGERGTGPPGLLYVSGGATGKRWTDEGVRARIAETIAGGGAVYLAPPRLGLGRRADELLGELGISTCVVLGTGGTDEALRISGDQRPLAWMIPAQAGGAGSPLPPVLRRGLSALRRRAGRLLRGRGGSAAGRVSEPDRALGVERIAAPGSLDGRAGLVLRTGGDAALPAYLLEAAATAGFPLDPGGWRLAPPRGYRSQKVIFFVRTADGRPAVVKLTQDPAFNPLLENEADALEALAEADLSGIPSIPELHFRARHAGLSIVAESALTGAPFPQRSLAGAWSADSESVVAALTSLGERTARPGGGDVGAALEQVVAQYASLYEPPPAERERLRAAASGLGELGAELPVVFMHGDATVFNVLVDSAGRAGLVDWENAERAGMPLWDLFHFLHSHDAWTAEASGTAPGDGWLDDPLGTGGAAASPSLDAIGAYRTALGVPEAAVEPLQLLWMARHAVREARQLPRERLGESGYRRLLAGRLARSSA